MDGAHNCRSALADGFLVEHHVLVARVPLEQQSMARLMLGFVGTIVVPVAAAFVLVLYCFMQFSNAFVDLLGHIPFL
jgi:hypothetical protein